MDSTKEKYVPRSWRDYNRSLVERGNITLWLGRDTLKSWLSKQRPGPHGGRREVFSDTAILALMILKTLYRMPYRMAEGFARSLLLLLKLDLPVPHFTRICKRSKRLDLSLLPKGKKRITDIVIDSSGVKVYGAGEWQGEKGYSNKKKKWKKIHVAIDPETQQVILTDITSKNTHDSKMLPSLLRRINGKIRDVILDGAYDTRACYKAIVELEGNPIIPPRKGAQFWEEKEQWAELRNQRILERIGFGLDEIGKLLWKKCSGYTSRSLVETYFSRFKRAFGDRAYSISDMGLCIENKVKSWIMNIFARDLPKSILV